MQGFRRLCKAVGQPILGSDKRQPCANGDCPVGTAAAVHVQSVTGALPCSVRGRAHGGGPRDWLEGNTAHLRPRHAAQLCQQALILGNTHSCLVRLRAQHSNCIFQQSAVGNRLNKDTLTAHVLLAAAAAATTTVCEANTDTEANTRPDLDAIQRLCCSCPSPCRTHSSSSCARFRTALKPSHRHAALCMHAAQTATTRGFTHHRGKGVTGSMPSCF